MNKPVEERFEAEPHSTQIVNIDSNFPKVVRVQALTTLPAEPPRFTFDHDESNGQAEDGIRDQPRSRGLGDVYKRQVYVPSMDSSNVIEVQGEVYVSWATTNVEIELEVLLCNDDPCDMSKPIAVSYTHLTLPTIYSV